MNNTLLIIIVFLSNLFADLIHPINDSKLNYIHVMFQWEEILDVTTYQFQLSTTSDYSSLIIDTTISELYYINKNNIEWDSNYYWRVKHNQNNVLDNWINEFAFLTGNPSYVFASLDVDPVEIITRKSSALNGITIYGVMDPFYSAAIDINGKEIWNSAGIDSYMFSSISNNHIFLGNANLPPLYKGELGIEFDLEDGIVWTQPTYGDEADFLQHELIKLSNGNYMGFVITYKDHFVPNSDDYPQYFPDSINFDFSFENSVPGWDGTFAYPWAWKTERIVEWDVDGNEVWSWNTFDYFNLDDFDFINGFWEYAIANNDPFDWTHFNALAYDENENMIYVSSKNLSRITKIDKSTSEIIWNVGRRWLGESNIIEPNQIDRFSGQHGLQLLDNGNLVLFDNGISSGINDGTSIDKSRAMEIKIAEINGEYNLEIIWSYTLPVELYGVISGNTQKLYNGNYLITTVGSTDGAHSVEVTPAGDIVWDCKFNIGTPQGAIYRAMKIPGLYESEYDNTLSTTTNLIPTKSYKIKSTYPNPFNPIVNIEYELYKSTSVQFEIININGQQIDLIEHGIQFPGVYTAKWNGTNYPSGIYLLRLNTNSASSINKIILLK